MKSPCDDVCINDQQTNGFASVQFWNCTARVAEVAPASAASVWWVQSRLHSEEKASQVNLVVLDSLFPDLEELQVWAASIHTFPFKELLLLRRFKYPASQPLANCDIVLHRLANFDFACKAAMGSGRNEMSIDRGKFYLHSFANTSLKTCHHPWMNHSDIVQEKSLNMASWHTSAWELLLGLLAKRQVKRPPMISPQGIFGHFPLRPFRSFRSCHAKMHKNAAPRSWPVRWT